METIPKINISAYTLTDSLLLIIHTTEPLGTFTYLLFVHHFIQSTLFMVAEIIISAESFEKWKFLMFSKLSRLLNCIKISQYLSLLRIISMN